MQINAKVDYQKVRFNKKNKVNLMVEIEAPEQEASEKRNPLALCAVIDRSGSMAERAGTFGTKLDAVKKSLYKLIDHLTEDDSLSLVFFDNNITSVEFKKMDSGAKDAMKREIANVQPGGSWATTFPRSVRSCIPSRPG